MHITLCRTVYNMQYIVEEAGSLVYIKELASSSDISLHQNVQNITVNTTV